MKLKTQDSIAIVLCSLLLICTAANLFAQDAHFHNAPSSSSQAKNPYAGQHRAVAAGAKLYTMNCGSCHGNNGIGSGNVPALRKGPAQTAPDGEVFWFITTGSVNNGMPSWAQLSEQERWQIVTYVKSLKNSPDSQAVQSSSANVKPARTNAPPPKPPFTDFRFEEPGKSHKITVQDLPTPYAAICHGIG